MSNPPTTGKLEAELQVREAMLPAKLRDWRAKLSTKAKQEKRFRFYSLYGLVGDPETLRAAWMQVRANGGAPGVDGVSIEQIEKEGVEAFLEELGSELAKHRYGTGAVRSVYIPKGNGKLRPLGIPNLRDRVVQTAEGGIGGKIGEDFFGRALPPGKHSLVFDFKYDGPGPGKSGTGVLTVDGKELAKKKLEHTIPLMMTIDETFDVGIDTRTGVDDSYKLPFKFTGTIDKLTFKLGPSQLAEADKKAQAEAYANAND